MTTTEFAALVVNALEECNYFKKNERHHPGDICASFATVSETLGVALSWAISKNYELSEKKAMMESSDIKKSTYTPSSYTNKFIDDETIEYSEWKKNSK